LEKLSSVRVTFGGHLEVSAPFMATWIANALADVGIHVEVTLTPVDGSSLRVELTGDGLQVELARDGDRLVVTLNGASHCTNFPKPTDYLLMREELGIVRHDAAFERILASANVNGSKS
jgi:hypothetical protein